MYHRIRNSATPLLAASLLLLSGCTTLQTIYEESDLDLFTSSEKRGEATDKLEARMLLVDRASNKAEARNAMMHELIAESDSACNNHLTQISNETAKWKLTSQSPGQLDQQLDHAISSRMFDKVDPDLSGAETSVMANPDQALTEVILATIKRSRTALRSTLDRRMQRDIHHYSVKQGLIDLKTYHSSCTTAFAASELSRTSQQRMTPEEKEQKIEALMQLRKKLMAEGLNPRPVQHKIDAIIMAD